MVGKTTNQGWHPYRGVTPHGHVKYTPHCNTVEPGMQVPLNQVPFRASGQLWIPVLSQPVVSAFRQMNEPGPAVQVPHSNAPCVGHGGETRQFPGDMKQSFLLPPPPSPSSLVAPMKTASSAFESLRPSNIDRPWLGSGCGAKARSTTPAPIAKVAAQGCFPVRRCVIRAGCWNRFRP